MKNLFDKSTLDEVVKRLNSLNSQSQRQWGKMNVAQMLAHCKVAFEIPLSSKPFPRMFMGRLMGWLIKPMLFNKKPLKKNSPTASEFIIKVKKI
ncbi:MAG: DUF1569 domain-containing protein [Chitinophagaceae bacterium]|nr:DUF1569 domain-containing protein [Chitinophagaceae bacterium]